MLSIKKICDTFCLLKVDTTLWCLLGAIPFSIVGFILGIMIGAYLGAEIGGRSGGLFTSFYPWDWQKRNLTFIIAFIFGTVSYIFIILFLTLIFAVIGANIGNFIGYILTKLFKNIK